MDRFVSVAFGTLIVLLAGCAQFPDAQYYLGDNQRRTAEFQTARGRLSPQQTAAVLDELKRKVGAIDILQTHIALEESIVGRPMVLGNKVDLLQDGPATYRAMFAALRGAKDHINLETYIFEDDETGREFADLLLEKRRLGLRVNLIYDSVGSLATPAAFFKRLTEGGVQVVEFNPVNPLTAKRGWQINNRDHRKLLIVDGRIAFVGGINISDVYARGSAGSSLSKGSAAGGSSGGWRDTHVQIEGPVVAEFQKLFLATWSQQQELALEAKEYFPPLPAKGRDVVHAIGSSPADPYSVIYLTLLSAITQAERQINITNAYFAPDPQMRQALIDAAARGVAVTLILPSESDFWAILYAGRSHYTALLEAGIKVYQRRGALLHAKSAVIDGVWSCVGSTNLDWRSFLHNNEVDAVVLGYDFAQQMQAMFERDLAASDAIDLERWKRRPLSDRIKEWSARMWEYWL